jgi:hypothetical protein
MESLHSLTPKSGFECKRLLTTVTLLGIVERAYNQAS